MGIIYIIYFSKERGREASAGNPNQKLVTSDECSRGEPRAAATPSPPWPAQLIAFNSIQTIKLGRPPPLVKSINTNNKPFLPPIVLSHSFLYHLVFLFYFRNGKFAIQSSSRTPYCDLIFYHNRPTTWKE